MDSLSAANDGLTIEGDVGVGWTICGEDLFFLKKKVYNHFSREIDNKGWNGLTILVGFNSFPPIDCERLDLLEKKCFQLDEIVQ